jgi:hypothetical protein
MSPRLFHFPDDHQSSLIGTPPSVQEALEKAPPAPTFPGDALSLFPDEASINSARNAGELSSRPLPAETIECMTARSPSVSTLHATPLHEAARCSDEAVATAVEWISLGTIDAPRVRVAAISEDLAHIASTVLALEARISRLTAKDQPLAVSIANAPELDRRSVEIAAHLQATALAAEAQTAEIASHLVQVGQIGDRLATLQAAIGELIEPDQPLTVSEARAELLERRGAEISAGLERAATIAEGQAIDIAERLREADDLGDRLSALETRIATLHAPDHALARGAAETQALERRGAAIVAQVEHIAAQLERAASATEASKRDIAAGLLAVDEIGEQLSRLETRIHTAQEQQLATVALGVQQLEQRSADIVAQFLRATAVSDAQWADIGERVAQATDIGERVSRLETRMSKLIGHGQLLERADDTVGQLEQRTRNTIDELERARQTQDDREREIARLHEQLARLNEAVRNHIGTVGKRGSRSGRREVTLGVVAGITAVGLTGILALRSPHVASEERNGASNRASIAVAVAVLPATPLPAGIGGIHVPPTAPPPRMKVLAERRIASTEQRRSPEPVRAQKPFSGFERSSAVSVIKSPTSLPAFIGALDIESDPAGSTVFIDGKVVGETPVHVTDLRAGSHVVWIVRHGYQRWTASVPVPADKRTRIKATLALESTR